MELSRRLLQLSRRAQLVREAMFVATLAVAEQRNCAHRTTSCWRISRADLGLLEPYLEAIDLPVRNRLQKRNKRISHVDFPDSVVAFIQ